MGEPDARPVRLERLNISFSLILTGLLALMGWWVNYQNNRLEKIEADVDMLQMANFEVQLGISNDLGAIRSDITKLTTTMDNVRQSLEDLKRAPPTNR